MRALVTGASAGIGRAFAAGLAARGYAVTAVARGEEGLLALRRELGPGHAHLVADLTTPAGLATVAEHLARDPVNVLVNNAGTAVTGPFADVALADSLATLNLNCAALVTLAHAFLRHARRGDALVNISSTLAFAPTPTLGVYSGTKAFVTTFSEALWRENKGRGVHVLGVCPGMTATRSRPDEPGGMVQAPEEVAAAALAALAKRRRPTVVSGVRNKVFVAATRLLPRAAVVSMLG
ncbi:SDR family oxidoreductase [Micromonospora sp. 4G55]|uniref:SDR family NAD(P)-dependent oxidoreductase n=1 Tax=Micromonospora sp. 4G55 TaxID=2806102 RepID=UPI001A54C3A0|nr:SDR family NAD(P)-dependent oxidoreductase [Micromonospora sp. 4G55]MBM0259432.1 SDR family NAD(P)-dependent oxidoreductase [Micromonospora sp. 4G55]